MRSPQLRTTVLLASLLAALAGTMPASGGDGPFLLPEIDVARSPLGASELACDAPVVALAVAPAGPTVALLLRRPAGDELVLWPVAAERPSAAIWRAGAGEVARGVAWHPREQRLFVAIEKAGSGKLVAVDVPDPVRLPVTGKEIASFDRPLAGVLACPAPFVTAWAEGDVQERVEHRLFLTTVEADRSARVVSVTESGTKPYQVLGPESSFTPESDEWLEPSKLAAESASAVAFHPSGRLLLWRDGKGGFHVATYARLSWGESRELLPGTTGGHVEVVPNGAWLVRGRPDAAGVELYLGPGAAPRTLAPRTRFVVGPGITADGRGLVGSTGDGRRVVYEPVDIPLADVTNLWMFVARAGDAALFGSHGGALRSLELEQLYALYESEAYDCGSYDRSTPTRPYLVTTDIFWELFASAYEGLFLVKERTAAIPAFWRFVAAARTASAAARPESRVTRLLATLDAVHGGDAKDAEAALVLGAEGVHPSPALGEDFDYGELRPRGHYAAEPGLATYFKAFSYLTRAPLTEADRGELAALPPEVQRAALDWVRPYLAFIAPSRARSPWGALPPPPAYCRHPLSELRPFPLSWGFDNEAMDATTYHSERPGPERIEGPEGPRILPSGLDVAAAMGSATARTLLAPEIARYPNLAAALDALAARRPKPQDAPGLYERWLEALATQWAGSPELPGRPGASPLWDAKRLQTGLASWATLRHATVLVNERGEAECGEGGYEPIVLRPPRGYVEPDPETFEAIARLFDAARSLVKADPALAGISVKDEDRNDGALEEGIARRLEGAAAKARLFGAMAAKERRGEELTDGEQVEILDVARVAEHAFKIFKSLAREDLALANPEPIAKVADVYGGATTAYLHVGVGDPMEWDLVVPFHGRRQVVKGAVYDYRETTSAPGPMDDEAWREGLEGIPHPAFIVPYLSPARLACPPPDPF